MQGFETSTFLASHLPSRPRVKTAQDWPWISLDDIGTLRAQNDTTTPAKPAQIGVIRLALRWIATNATKAPIAVRRKVTGSPGEADTNHELARIWNESQPTKLVLRILEDLYLRGRGNALLRKVRNPGSKQVLRLEAIDIEKCTRDKNLKIWMENGRAILPQDLVWFSIGADPDDFDSGVDQWDGFEDDLRTLREEPKYTADILQNGGVVGLMITRDDPLMSLSEDATKRMQKDAKALTTGKNRGSALVSGTGLKVTEIGSTPEKMALRDLTIWASARVAANLQMSLMVLGLPDPGKTYSNLREATKGCYRTAVIGFHDLIAQTLDRDLLPDTGYSKLDNETVWIYDHLEEFQEDLDTATNRIIKLAGGPVLSPNEARIKIGEAPTDDPAADLIRQTTTPGLPA